MAKLKAETEKEDNEAVEAELVENAAEEEEKKAEEE